MTITYPYFSRNGEPKGYFTRKSRIVTMSLWGLWILIQRPHHWHGLLEFASTLPLGGGPDANSDWPWNTIFNFPCRNPCRLFIHDRIFGPLGPRLLVWNELGRSRHFRRMRDRKMQWLWAFSLVCQVALTTNLRFLCMNMPGGQGASRMASV